MLVFRDIYALSHRNNLHLTPSFSCFSRGSLQCRVGREDVPAPDPAWPLWQESCPLAPHECSHAAPLGSNFSPLWDQGQMTSAAAGGCFWGGRNVRFPLALSLSLSWVCPSSHWSPRGGEMVVPRVPKACALRSSHQTGRRHKSQCGFSWSSLSPSSSAWRSVPFQSRYPIPLPAMGGCPRKGDGISRQGWWGGRQSLGDTFLP